MTNLVPESYAGLPEETSLGIVYPVVKSDKSICWELYTGLVHRESGPAIIYPSGTRIWIIAGKNHREDGPAYIAKSGTVSWYLMDRCYDIDEYCIVLTRDYGKTDEDIMMIRMQYDTN